MSASLISAPSSGTQFATFLEVVPDAIIGVDGDGDILLVNSQAESMFGYSREELIGQQVELLVPVSAREAHSQLRASYVENSQSRPKRAPVELVGRRKDGSEFPAEISLTAIDVDGRSIVSAAVRDITDRKRAEARFQSLLEAWPAAIVGVNPDGLIALVNAETESLFGYTRAQLIGQPVELLVPEAALYVHTERPTRYVRDSHTLPSQAWMALAGRRRDGSNFPAEICLSSIETETGLMVCAAIRDATERVASQRERDRLEAQHERDRLERQLHQSHRLESLGQLAGGVAHDFNNLLAAILNYASFVSEEIAAEITQRGRLDHSRLDSALSDVTQIQAAGERAARLTHQLLAFGRREVRNLEVLDVNAIVGDVETLLGRTIGEDVHLVTQCAPDLKPVRADRGQVEQVLLNLAVNARDAMPGGGTLTVTTENCMLSETFATRHAGMLAGPHVRVRVTDTGEGMDRATMERAFEPFFSTKSKDRGSGLGLATVYGIVTQSAGTVDIKSAKGAGTTVTILLPSVSSPVTPAVVPRATRRRRAGETILVVEDEDLVLDVASRILSSHGYHVLTARNGEQALALLDSHRGPVHLLLTDVVMPGLTGDELAERVARVRPKIRVLYMSGYPEPVITAQGVIHPGIRLVAKPFVTPDLLNHVRAVLDS